MKFGIKIVAAIMFLNLFGCKSKKSVVAPASSDKTTVTLQVIFTEMYCGGAAPTEDILQEMQSPKPLANATVYLAMMTEPIKESMAFKTDKEGRFTCSLDSGFYQIYLYDPMPLLIQNPELTEKEKCEQSWKLEQRFPVMIKKGLEVPEVLFTKMCNPCEEPRP